MSAEHLDELIAQLNAGNLEAAERVFQAYEPYLRLAIRRQLDGPLRAKLDSMDIVQMVWADVLAGYRESGWHFADRAHLGAFLTRVARNRLIDHRRRFRPALERERSLSDSDVEDLPRSPLPRPSEVAPGNELG